ncbi:hypothetical protein [Pseudoalteromonas tunicata]|uniref:Uncharacterized protein n=1 Tax=Pseudoalteromonas tunicata D2 TaxID=87626 RepID=A4C9E2_9GAMM|nr:hypothetical protein [Pseudoalteromonas tunicata]ATC93711.1 hypothetical protein PTUN_a1013 [Pseudoalteromonas tunicata]AXT29538.1 hypothetical protein D1819_00975 [Pseudoalteromonas tunicata]EAR29207.1 hypothetical protein PTD2_09184 [Pseudoalteromonas tunicata D2]
MKFKYLKALLIYDILLYLLLNSSVSATPVSPEVDNIASRFSVDMQSEFHLFSDSINRRLVWYIPKVGGIRKIGSRPAFTVSSSTIETGPFSGESAVSFQGKFNALSRTPNITRLSTEAASKGYYIKPAEVSAADTRFLLAGFQLDNNGILRTTCNIETWQSPNGSIQIPVCKALDDQGNWQEVDFLSSFLASLPIEGNVEQDIPFSGQTLPGWHMSISDLLVTGSSWDAEIQLLTDWKLKTNTQLKDARINIRWRELVRYMISKMIENRYWSITKGHLDNILAQAISSRNGMSVLYYHSNGSTSQSPEDLSQKTRIKNNLLHLLRKELFIPVFSPRNVLSDLVKRPDPINPYLPYTTPTLEEVERKWSKNSYKVYEKIIQPAYSVSINKNSAYYPPPQCPYTSSADSTIAYQCHEPDPCSYSIQGACQPPPPPVWEARYILKSNYWRLLSSPSSNFNIYLNGIEILNASTYMTIDCIEGDVDVPLRYIANCH